MCGIYITNLDIGKDKVTEKLNSIKFRGPDNLGIEKVGKITLGHLRLAILDLDERANQPMVKDNLHITFNGEIYNFLSIKEELMVLGHQFYTTSDTEVLLCGYKEWGAAIADKINGMFAFCIYDALKQTIFCVRDRLGVKPFYYYWKDGYFEICSQIRPLSENKKLCEEAISIFLDCTFIPSPFSIFEDVYKLPPGNYLEIDLLKKTLTITEYWNLKKVNEKKLSYEEAKDKLHTLLIDSVKIRLQSDVPIGSFLSGGIDSALVSSIAAKISDKPINTFTIGFDNPEFDESKVAAQYAKIIGSNHVETMCKPADVMGLISKLVTVYDEPFGDSSALPSLLLNSTTKQYVTVALSGDGGDESFLGYNHFDKVKKFHQLIKVPFFIRVLLSKALKLGPLKRRAETTSKILRFKSINEVINGVFTGYSLITKNPPKRWLSNYSLFEGLADTDIQKMADQNIKLWLENDSNVKVDRASMAYSVEVRSPFLDYRIIELAREFPVSYRYLGGNRKRILKDILKEYIPEEVFTQPKKGFAIPIGQWIRNELREEFVQTLSDDFLNIVPNLNVPKFKEMFKLHQDGTLDYSSFIWRVYILAKWYKEFGYYKAQ